MRSAATPLLAGTLLGLLALQAGCSMERERAMGGLKSPAPAVRAEALSVLGSTKDPELADTVAAFLVDPSPRVRRGAVAALGALGPGKHLGQVASRLRDGDLEVRLAAVRVLGDSGRTPARSLLVPMLEDPSVVVRGAASQALTALGLEDRDQARALAARLQGELLQQLSSPQAQVRAEAARELGLGAQAGTYKPLRKLLEDPSPLVVRAAAEAMGRAGGDQAVDDLVGLARSRDARDRQAAVLGLGEAGTGRAGEALAELLGEGDPATLGALLEGMARVLRGPGGGRAASWVRETTLCPLLAGNPRSARPAARLVKAAGLECTEARARLAARVAADGGEGFAPVLAELPGDEATSALLRAAERLLARYLIEATPWVPDSHWASLRGEPAQLPSEGPAGGRVDPAQRKALQRLLAPFKAQYPEDGDEDPLLPPHVDLKRVTGLLALLGGRPGAARRLADLAEKATGALRVAALTTLAALEPPAAAEDGAGAAARQGPALAAALATGTSALETVPAEDVARAVRAGLRAKELDVRRAAAAGCPLLGGAAAAEAMSLLKEPDFELRSHGARCLGELRSGAAVPALLELLRRERMEAAMEALAAIGDHRATAELVALLQEDHPADRQGERAAVVQALGRLEDPSAAPALERELRHPYWQVRLASARALSKAGRPASAGALTSCQEDFYQPVRRACRESIRAVSGAGK